MEDTAGICRLRTQDTPRIWLGLRVLRSKLGPARMSAWFMPRRGGVGF
jgi:hypothetical protein